MLLSSILGTFQTQIKSVYDVSTICSFDLKKVNPMANVDPKKKVPNGKARFFVTKQMKPTKSGYVGYETVWEPFQKEAKYETPKRP